MRIAFYILLAVNLLFFAWSYWVDAPDPGPGDSAAHLPRLQLVTESPPTRPTSAVTTERMLFRAQAAIASCLSVGPFNDMATAAREARTLQDQGFKPQQRAEEGDILDGYWVYVGGMKDDAEVTSVAQRLTKSGFDDAHVMKESQDGRKISVGLFTEHSRAEKRAKLVRQLGLGLEPEIVERKFPGTVYWVDVSLPPGMRELPARGLLADAGSVIRVGLQSCPVGAGARPIEPVNPRQELRHPADEDQYDTIFRSLPRTTVAGAPKQP